MPQVKTCPVQPGFRATSCRHCVRKHWLPVNQRVGNKPRSRRASVLFHPVITCAAGETTSYCAAHSDGRGKVLQRRACDCPAAEKTEEREWVTWGFFKVEVGEYMLVCQMNHQQGVAPHCPPAPAGSCFLFIPSHTRQTVETFTAGRDLVWCVYFIDSGSPHSSVLQTLIGFLWNRFLGTQTVEWKQRIKTPGEKSRF